MATTSTEKKVQLKLMIDTKANKVMFAEAEKGFVDFLFQIMSLPLSIVVKLLNAEGMMGSLGSLYKCIESMSPQHFESKMTKDSVLKPKATVVVPLLSLRESPNSLTVYKCDAQRRISDCPGAECGGSNCPCRFGSMPEMSYSFCASSDYIPPGYVKSVVVYTVMDNLEVKPMSVDVIKSHVKSFDALKAEMIQVGSKEALAILKASLDTDAVLTTVFLRS